MTSQHLATVVIPARDEANVIGVQLAALAAQAEADRLEVLVVDNGSTDGTAAVARAFGDRLPGLRVLEASDRASQGYARNVGIAAAESDSILLCDADDRVFSGWARSLLDALGSADSVAGLVVSWDGVTTPTLPTVRESFAVRFDFLPAFGGNNAAFKKDIWTELGGFDESIHPAEDIDLSWRIQLAGYTLALAPKAVVFGRERNTTLGQFKQTYRYGKSQVALFARHRAAGMPRTSTSDSIRSFGSLLRHVPEVAHGPSTRRAWCARAGWRLGRLTGSVQQRTLNL